MAEGRGPDDDAADDLDGLATKALAQARADRAARIAANRRKREAAAEAARRSVHSFILMWEDLEGWTGRYDPVEVGQELNDAQWSAFEQTFAASVEFVDAARAARGHRPCDAMTSA